MLNSEQYLSSLSQDESQREKVGITYDPAWGILLGPGWGIPMDLDGEYS